MVSYEDLANRVIEKQREIIGDYILKVASKIEGLELENGKVKRCDKECFFALLRELERISKISSLIVARAIEDIWDGKLEIPQSVKKWLKINA